MSARSIVPSPPSTTARSARRRRGSTPCSASSPVESSSTPARPRPPRARDGVVDVSRRPCVTTRARAQPTASRSSRRARRGSCGRVRVDEVEDELTVSLRPGQPGVYDPGDLAHPTPRAASATSRSTRRCTSGSRTTPLRRVARGPPRTGASRARAPASPAPRERAPAAAPAAREMNETSQVTSCGANGSSLEASARSSARAPSRAGRRGCLGCSWPCPTSSAITRAAPRCSSTSVKPPVDAPTSRQSSPARVDAERVERVRELVARARDVRRRPLDLERRRVVDLLAGLRVAGHEPGHHEAPVPAPGSRRGRARRAARRAASS